MKHWPKLDFAVDVEEAIHSVHKNNGSTELGRCDDYVKSALMIHTPLIKRLERDYKLVTIM